MGMQVDIRRASLPPVLRRPLQFGDVEQIAAIRELEQSSSSVKGEKRTWFVEVDLSAEFEISSSSEEEAIAVAKLSIPADLLDNATFTAV